MAFNRQSLERIYQLHLAKLVRFGVVGAGGTAVNTVMLWLLARLAGLPIALASMVATEVAIINNFLLNDTWTFRTHARERSFLRRLFQFNFVSLGGMVITVGVVYGTTTFGHLGLIVANVIAACITLVWNYAINSRWTWRAAAVSTTTETPTSRET